MPDGQLLFARRRLAPGRGFLLVSSGRGGNDKSFHLVTNSPRISQLPVS